MLQRFCDEIKETKSDPIEMQKIKEARLQIKMLQGPLQNIRQEKELLSV